MNARLPAHVLDVDLSDPEVTELGSEEAFVEWVAACEPLPPFKDEREYSDSAPIPLD